VAESQVKQYVMQMVSRRGKGAASCCNASDHDREGIKNGQSYEPHAQMGARGLVLAAESCVTTMAK